MSAALSPGTFQSPKPTKGILLPEARVTVSDAILSSRLFLCFFKVPNSGKEPCKDNINIEEINGDSWNEFLFSGPSPDVGKKNDA